MFKKVNTKEIRNISDRLEAELMDQGLPFQRKKEVEKLLSYLNMWLGSKDRPISHKEWFRREVIEEESSKGI